MKPAKWRAEVKSDHVTPDASEPLVTRRVCARSVCSHAFVTGQGPLYWPLPRTCKLPSSHLEDSSAHISASYHSFAACLLHPTSGVFYGSNTTHTGLNRAAALDARRWSLRFATSRRRTNRPDLQTTSPQLRDVQFLQQSRKDPDQLPR